MNFIVATKGRRPSESKVFISKSAKTISLSAGFCREHKINLSLIKYARLAMDPETKDIAIELSETKDDSGQYLKLTPTQTKTAAACSVNSLLVTFNIQIGEISGTYKESAVIGPVKINGFSSNAFILKTKYREI